MRVSIRPDQKVQCAATVTGLANTAVTWSISPQIGSISSTGIYNPVSVSLPQTVTFTATSVANPAVSASGIIIINTVVASSPASSPANTAASITVTPLRVSVRPGQNVQCAAAVAGLANTAVTWSISTQIGSISSTGIYDPPSVTSPQTITFTATSVANPAVSASGTIIINPVISVTVAPATLQLSPAASAQFTASVSGNSNQSVSWSISSGGGSISANGVYTAPSSVSSNQTVT
ncbi:MAG TPA: hypothetical protein VG345_15125, partial [Bryobacteraceae bacterium]|nr:hypothetical protein [Bryobacteraceae bacterium]